MLKFNKLERIINPCLHNSCMCLQTAPSAEMSPEKMNLKSLLTIPHIALDMIVTISVMQIFLHHRHRHSTMPHHHVDILTPPIMSEPRFWVKIRAVQRVSATFLCPSRPIWIFFPSTGEHETRWSYMDYQVNTPTVVDSTPFSLVRNGPDDIIRVTFQIIPHPIITNSQPVQSPRKARLEMTPISYNWCPLRRTWCSTWSSRALGRVDCAAPSVQHCTGQCWHVEEGLPPPTTVLPFLVSNYSSIRSYLLLSALLRWFLDTKKVLYLHLFAF